MLRTLAIGSVAAASLVVPSTAHALGPGLGCGDTVTTDVVLTHDLLDCPEVGLVVGADDITIDLGGHTVDGALGDAELGIDDTAGHSGLTVTNGTIHRQVRASATRPASRCSTARTGWSCARTPWPVWASRV